MALTADNPRTYELGDINEFTVDAGVTVYEGAFTFVKKADGLAVVAAVAISTHVFAGIAIEKATAGNRVRLKHHGKVVASVTGAGIDAVGKIVYASDDNTLTLTAGTNVPVGYVHRYVSGTTCIVEFRATVERDVAVV